jgi:hypothetical protein
VGLPLTVGLPKDKLWKGGGSERLSDFSFGRKQWIVIRPALRERLAKLSQNGRQHKA